MESPGFPAEEVLKLRNVEASLDPAEEMFAESGQYGPEAVESPDNGVPTPTAPGPCEDCLRSERRALIVGTVLGVGLGIGAFVMVAKLSRNDG